MTHKTYEVHTCFSTHRGFVKHIVFDKMEDAYKGIANEVDEGRKDNFNIDVESTYKIVVKETDL